MKQKFDHEKPPPIFHMFIISTRGKNHIILFKILTNFDIYILLVSAKLEVKKRITTLTRKRQQPVSNILWSATGRDIPSQFWHRILTKLIKLTQEIKLFIKMVGVRNDSSVFDP